MGDFIDFHVHISTGFSTPYFYPDFTLTKLLENQTCGNIKKSVCFINPFVPQILCPQNPRHKIKIIDSPISGFIQLLCTDCKNLFYHGIDPIREVNIEFLNQVKNISSIIPFVYLNVCASNINEEIEFYEKLFPNLIKGYKVHPTLSNRSLSEINIETTSKPILVHTGVEDCANPLNAIKFAKKYNGKVILAHLARFNKEALSHLNSQDNLYVDTSPMTFLYDLYLHKPHRLYDASWFASNANSCTDFYLKLFSTINHEKIVFASDAPFSDYSKEMIHLNNLPPSFLDIWNNNAKIILNNSHNNQTTLYK